MCTYVVVIGVRVHPGMAFIKINSIKYKRCKYLLTKILKNPQFCAFPIEKYRLGPSDPLHSTLTGLHDPVEGGNSAFSAKMIAPK